MNLLGDIITYIRRIIKTPSNASISDNLLIDYINRFWIMDVDARMQLFDLKTRYAFQTVPGVDQYNMPLYDQQFEPGNQTIGSYPVYQGFLGPAYINGVPVPFQTQKDQFYNLFSSITNNFSPVAIGDGGATYSFNIPFLSGVLPVPNNPPINGILRGHIDISGIIALGTNIDPPLADTSNASVVIPQVPVTSVSSAVYITSIDGTGASVVVADSGQFLVGNVNYGLLMSPGHAPNGNTDLGLYSTASNTINYLTGQVNVTFPVNIPVGNNINLQCSFLSTGLPSSILYYNNTLTLRAPPDRQYLVELTAYLTPAAFLRTGDTIQFGYMAEYIARGAARKILSDTGDIEQFQFYEPLFREQEMLVWKRSQRQFTANRTETIYSQGSGQGQGSYNNYGGNFR